MANTTAGVEAAVEVFEVFDTSFAAGVAGVGKGEEEEEEPAVVVVVVVVLALVPAPVLVPVLVFVFALVAATTAALVGTGVVPVFTIVLLLFTFEVVLLFKLFSEAKAVSISKGASFPSLLLSDKISSLYIYIYILKKRI